MNVNEVIANAANVALGGELGAKSPVHPNDHVNMSQSSNDFDPDRHAYRGGDADRATICSRRSKHLQTALDNKANEFATIVKIGRTHTMDATPDHAWARNFPAMRHR